MTEFTRIATLKAKLQPLNTFSSLCDPLDEANPLDFDFSYSNILYQCESAPLAHITSKNLQKSGVIPHDVINDLQDHFSYKPSRRSTELSCASTRHESCASIFENLYELSPAKQRTFQSVLGELDQAKQVETNLYELEPQTVLMEKRQHQSQNQTDQLCQQRFTFFGACTANELTFTNACSQFVKEKIDAQHMDNETTFGALSTEFNAPKRRNSVVFDGNQELADDLPMSQETSNDSADVQGLIESTEPAQAQSFSEEQPQEMSAPHNPQLGQNRDELQSESLRSKAEFAPKMLDSERQESNKTIKRQQTTKVAEKEKKQVFILQRKSLKIKKDSKKASSSKLKAKLLSTSDNKQACFKCNHCPRVFESPQGLGGHMSKAHLGLSECYARTQTVRDFNAPKRKAQKQATLQVLTIMRENGQLGGWLQSYLKDVESGKDVKKLQMSQLPIKYVNQIKKIMKAMI